MTYNNTTGVTKFRACPYIGHYNTTHVVRVCYIRLPNNVSLLNEFLCGSLNPEGPLCGKCKYGYGIALYSYTLQCSKCWGHSYGSCTISLNFPITVTYFLVLIFHIRAISSPLSQILVYTIRLNIPFYMYIENEVTGFHMRH